MRKKGRRRLRIKLRRRRRGMKRKIRRRRRGEEKEEADDDTMSVGKCVPEIRCGLMPASSGSALQGEATYPLLLPDH